MYPGAWTPSAMPPLPMMPTRNLSVIVVAPSIPVSRRAAVSLPIAVTTGNRGGATGALRWNGMRRALQVFTDDVIAALARGPGTLLAHGQT